MKMYSGRYGTMMRLRGIGDTFNALDAEDADQGVSFSQINDTAPPFYPQYSSGGPLTQSSDGTWIDQAFQLAEKALTIDQIRKLQKVNLDRVSRGLAPLPDSVYRQVQPGINVGIAPATEKFIWIGLAIAAVVGILAFSRR